jgi:hypothetical protein
MIEHGFNYLYKMIRSRPGAFSLWNAPVTR